MPDAGLLRHPWISTPAVACGGHDLDRPIAWRGSELVARARFLDDVAGWQASFSARPGARVALYFEDGYEFACALYGAWHAGKEVVIPGDALPATVDRLQGLVDIVAGQLPGAIDPVVLRDAVSPGARRHELDPRATYLTVFTSGSNGEPLAIVKRLDQIESEIAHLQQAFGERFPGGADASICATVSHQHIYGLLFCIFWPLACGRPLDTVRLVYPDQMAARLALRPAVLVSSPAHLRRLPDSVDWAGARKQLLCVFSSGGPLPPESAAECHQLIGHSPTEVYGSSETGGIAWRQRAFHGDRWTALPGIDWRLEDDVLSVRSAHLPDDNWFETSDRARLTEDGGFVLMGRADRIAKIEEKRISLTAVEAALCATGLIQEARAMAMPHAGSVRLVVVGVPTPQGWALMRDSGRRHVTDLLRTRLGELVERVALPRRWRFVRVLPVNSQGKTTEAMLQELFGEDMPSPQWLRRGEAEAVAELTVSTRLGVLEGHFPGLPLVPGIAQVDWAIALARQCFALAGEFQSLEALKFHRPITPGMRVQVHLTWQAGAGRLGFRYSSSEGVHSGGRAIFSATHV